MTVTVSLKNIIPTSVVALWGEIPTKMPPGKARRTNTIKRKLVGLTILSNCRGEPAIFNNNRHDHSELFWEMQLRNPGHFVKWRKGHEGYHAFLPWIQVGARKLQQSSAYFNSVDDSRGVASRKTTYLRRGPLSVLALLLTESKDPAAELFYRTHR